jgi:hypothetical protein
MLELLPRGEDVVCRELQCKNFRELTLWDASKKQTTKAQLACL